MTTQPVRAVTNPSRTMTADTFNKLMMQARADGWDAAVGAMKYCDGTAVEAISNHNPFREALKEQERTPK